MKPLFIHAAMAALLLLATACGPTSTGTSSSGNVPSNMTVKVVFENPEELNVAPDSYGNAEFKINVTADTPATLFFGFDAAPFKGFRLGGPETTFNGLETKTVPLTLSAESTASIGPHEVSLIVFDHRNFKYDEIARIPIKFNVIDYDVHTSTPTIIQSGKTNLIPLVITGFNNYSGPMEINAVDLAEGVTAKPLLIQFSGGTMKVDYPLDAERRALTYQQQLTLNFKSGGMNFKIKNNLIIEAYIE